MPHLWLSVSLLFCFGSPFFMPSLFSSSSSSSSFMASQSNRNSSEAPAITTPVTTVGGKTQCSPNTTYIQTNPSNFKAMVQKFTAFRQEKLTPNKLPTAAVVRPAGKSTTFEMGPRKPAFKLHERRLQSAIKLEITLNGGWTGSENVMMSPMSPFQVLGFGSPTSSTPTRRSTNSPPARPVMDEEMRQIRENGFYLYPRPWKGSNPPALLPLFPTRAGSDFVDDYYGDDNGDCLSSSSSSSI